MIEEHDCIQKENIGSLKAKWLAIERYMTEGNRWRIAILGIVFAIIFQVGGFLYLWGEVSTKVTRNERDIEKVLNKFDVMVSRGAIAPYGASIK